MTDRVEAIIAVPRDDPKPLGAQGAELRDKAIELMYSVADVDEDTVRFVTASDSAQLDFDGHVVSVWQQNLIAVIYRAEGTALPGVVDPIQSVNQEDRVYSVVGCRRDVGPSAFVAPKVTAKLVNFGEWLDSQYLLTQNTKYPADVPISELVDAYLDDENF